MLGLRVELIPWMILSMSPPDLGSPPDPAPPAWDTKTIRVWEGTGWIDRTVNWEGQGWIAQDRSVPVALPPAQLEACWQALRSVDARYANQRMGALVAAGAQTVAFLQERLEPVFLPDPARTAALIADLDNDSFAVRQQAFQELERLERRVEPALRRALAAEPTLESRRRMEQLLERLNHPVPSPEHLQILRAVRVLEHIGTAEAHKLLEYLAQGAPEARVTREAQAALQRLGAAGVYRP